MADIPSELVTGILQTMFGQGYLNSITIGILILLTGYIFLTFRFVVIDKDNKIWKKIKQTDKLIISFFMGFVFILVGAETLFIVVMILKAINGIQTFNSLGFTSDHVVFSSIFLYAFIFLYYFKRINNVFKQIEKYFIYVIKLIFLLFAFWLLSTLTINGAIGFILFLIFYFMAFESIRFNSFLRRLKQKLIHKSLPIAILVLATVLIAGCTQVSAPINAVVCKPNWVMGYGPIQGNSITDDACKAQCYSADKVTSHKIETTANPPLCTCYWLESDGRREQAGTEKDATSSNCNQICQKYKTVALYPTPSVQGVMENQTSTKTCYCDINNCNP